ncbi:MAG: MerR family transcriptional regulator [Eubacteriaceae bacterium]
MSLKIGDVSKLLNMTVETLRFYESENIIKPTRKVDSKYRVYETWDVFYLMECLKYRSFDISVRDISKILYAEDLNFFLKKLEEKQKKVSDTIRYNTMLAEKIEKYKSRLETVEFNEGNFWFENIPEQNYVVYVESNGDQYDDINKANSLLSELLKFLPFVEFGEHISAADLLSRNEVNHNTWSLLIENKYLNLLNLPFNDLVVTLPSHLALCTIVNAGEKGELSYKLLDPALEYLNKNNFVINGDITGKLLLRTHQDKQFCRYFEMQIPVKKDLSL